MSTDTKEVCNKLIAKIEEKREANVILLGILSAEKIASGQFEDTRLKLERNQGYINGLLEVLSELGVPYEELSELHK